MLQRAAAISVMFLLAHLAGFREYTGILNGTIGSLALGWNLSAFLAVIYIVFYLAFVILTPVLVFGRDDADVLAAFPPEQRKLPGK